MSNAFTNWIDGRIKVAVDEAMKEAKADVVAEIQSVEQTLTSQITLLPGLLGAQIENVAVDAGAIAAKVIAGIQGMLQSFNPFGGQR